MDLPAGVRIGRRRKNEKSKIKGEGLVICAPRSKQGIVPKNLYKKKSNLYLTADKFMYLPKCSLCPYRYI